MFARALLSTARAILKPCGLRAKNELANEELAAREAPPPGSRSVSSGLQMCLPLCPMSTQLLLRWEQQVCSCLNCGRSCLSRALVGTTLCLIVLKGDPLEYHKVKAVSSNITRTPCRGQC
jgi:hypothetical protein